MKPIAEWKTRSVVLTGMAAWAFLNVSIYFFEWAAEAARVSEAVLFAGFGAILGAVLFYSLVLINKNNGR